MNKKKLNGLFILNERAERSPYEKLFHDLKYGLHKFDINLSLAYSSTYLANIEKFDYPHVDFVIMYDNDYSLAIHFQNQGIKVFNSPLAILNCLSQATTYLLLENDDNVKLIPSVVSPTINQDGFSSKSRFVTKILEFATYPLVLKDVHTSDGDGVFLIKNARELKKHLAKVGAQQFIIQQYVKNSSIKDIRVYLIDHKFVSILAREQSDKLEFRSNVGAYEYHELLKDDYLDLIKDAIYISKILKLDFCSIDFLSDEDGVYYFCDANPNPLYKSKDYDFVDNIANFIRGKIND